MLIEVTQGLTWYFSSGKGLVLDKEERAAEYLHHMQKMKREKMEKMEKMPKRMQKKREPMRMKRTPTMPELVISTG